jgi:hypothetical protein
MNIKYKGIDLKSNVLLTHLQYINDVIVKKKYSGYLNEKVLHEYEVLDDKKYDYEISTSEKYRKKIQGLGIIREVFTTKRKYDRKTKKYKYFSYKYKIDKDLYLIWYSIVYLLSNFNRSDSNLINSRFGGLNLESVVDGLYASLTSGKLYEYTTNGSIDGENSWEYYYHNLFQYYYYKSLLDLYNTYPSALTEFNKFKTKTTLFLSDYFPLEDIYLKKKISNSLSVIYIIQSHIKSFNSFINRHKLLSNNKERNLPHTFYDSIKSEVWLSNDTFDFRDDSYRLDSIITMPENYSSSEEVIKEIRGKTNLFTFKRAYLKVGYLKKTKLDELKKDFATYVCHNSRLLHHLYEVKSKSDDLTNVNTYVYINVSFMVNRRGGTTYGYYFWISFRQFNQLCNLDLEDKVDYLRTKSIDYNDLESNFDLHGAVFAVAKLVNTGKFNPNDNIKKTIISEIKAKHKIELNKEDIKPLLFFCFFGESERKAYSIYKNRKKRPWFMEEYITEEESLSLPDLSEIIFKDIYQISQADSGGTTQFKYNIFMLESIFELTVLTALNSKTLVPCENIYDCFYFDKTLITKSEVIEIVSREARLFVKNITKIKKYPLNKKRIEHYLDYPHD